MTRPRRPPGTGISLGEALDAFRWDEAGPGDPPTVGAVLDAFWQDDHGPPDAPAPAGPPRRPPRT